MSSFLLHSTWMSKITSEIGLLSLPPAGGFLTQCSYSSLPLCIQSEGWRLSTLWNSLASYAQSDLMACRQISYFLLSSSVETVKLTIASFLCPFLILWNDIFCQLMNLIAFFMRSISSQKIQKTGWKMSLMQSTQRAVHLREEKHGKA